MYCSTNTRVGTYALHIWLIINLCVHVCVGSCVWGAMCGGAVCGELCVWGAVCWGAVWGGAVCPITRRSTHTHTIASSTLSKRRIPHFTLSNLVHCLLLVPLPRPCPHPQQQPGSPLQSVPTSPTACSSACAPSSSLSC